MRTWRGHEHRARPPGAADGRRDLSLARRPAPFARLRPAAAASHRVPTLVGPAVLAALAAVGILVVTEASGAHRLQIGIELVAVVIGVAVVRWRRNVFLGILAAVLIVAVVRTTTGG